MPKKNYKISTRFDAEGNMSKRVDKMSKGMSKLARMTNVAKRSMKAAAKAAAFFGRVVAKVAKTTIKLFAAGVLGLVGGITLLARSFSKIEDAQAAFTPLMGSVKGATDLVDALNKTAATTPFQFDTLSDTAMQLLPSMNGNIERTIELTRMLGDTAGGNAQKMESITRGYNKALIKGKVDLEALNMIAEAGVPIFQELGKETGKTGKKLFKDISAGRVSVEDLTNTFKTMTTKGGIFFNGMEIASQTLTGKISTLKDNISLAAAEIGQAMAPVLKEFTDDAIKIAKSIAAWAKENKALIASKFREYMIAARDLLVDTYKWFKKNGPAIKEFFGDVKTGAAIVYDIVSAIWKMKWAIVAAAGAYKAMRMAMQGSEMAKAAQAIDAVTIAEADAANKATRLGTAMKWAGGIIASFGVGWSIGEMLNKNLIDPLVAAVERADYELEKLTTNVQNNMKKMSTAKLQASAIDIKQKSEESRGFVSTIGKFFGGENGFGGAASSMVGQAKLFGEIDAEIASRPPTADGPQVQSSSTSRTETKNVTLTIKNDSGNRVESDGADFEGFDMVTTGGF